VERQVEHAHESMSQTPQHPEEVNAQGEATHVPEQPASTEAGDPAPIDTEGAVDAAADSVEQLAEAVDQSEDAQEMHDENISAAIDAAFVSINELEVETEQARHDASEDHVVDEPEPDAARVGSGDSGVNQPDADAVEVDATPTVAKPVEGDSASSVAEEPVEPVEVGDADDAGADAEDDPDMAELLAAIEQLNASQEMTTEAPQPADNLDDIVAEAMAEQIAEEEAAHAHVAPSGETPAIDGSETSPDHGTASSTTDSAEQDNLDALGGSFVDPETVIESQAASSDADSPTSAADDVDPYAAPTFDDRQPMPEKAEVKEPSVDSPAVDDDPYAAPAFDDAPVSTATPAASAETEVAPGAAGDDADAAPTFDDPQASAGVATSDAESEGESTEQLAGESDASPDAATTDPVDASAEAVAVPVEATLAARLAELIAPIEPTLRSILEPLSAPLRFVPAPLRAVVDVIALSLPVWVPIVWILLWYMHR